MATSDSKDPCSDDVLSDDDVVLIDDSMSDDSTQVDAPADAASVVDNAPVVDNAVTAPAVPAQQAAPAPMQTGRQDHGTRPRHQGDRPHRGNPLPPPADDEERALRQQLEALQTAQRKESLQREIAELSNPKLRAKRAENERILEEARIARARREIEGKDSSSNGFGRYFSLQMGLRAIGLAIGLVLFIICIGLFWHLRFSGRSEGSPQSEGATTPSRIEVDLGDLMEEPVRRPTTPSEPTRRPTTPLPSKSGR